MLGAVTQGVSALRTPANLLTFTRIALSPLLFAIILGAEDQQGAGWTAFALGWVLAATDFYDGRLARRAKSVSRMGAFLDPLADKIVVLGTCSCLVVVDRYWIVPVALIAVRELGITLWRTFWLRRGLSVPARSSAKYKTLVQGIALLVAVCPPLRDADALVAGVLWVAVAFTVYSGAQYVRDGRAATSMNGAPTY